MGNLNRSSGGEWGGEREALGLCRDRNKWKTHFCAVPYWAGNNNNSNMMMMMMTTTMMMRMTMMIIGRGWARMPVEYLSLY